MYVKNLWNMKVTMIPILIGALGTVMKRLLQGLEDLDITGRVKTIQTTVLLRSARILRRVLERPEETRSHSISSEKSSVNAGVKNSQRTK